MISIILTSLIQVMNEICYTCIEFMKDMVELFGIPYGALNTLLFVILGPLSTISSITSALFAYFEKKRTAIIFLIISLICVSIVIFMISLTFVYGANTSPYLHMD